MKISINKKGFSFIELIVVVAIMAVLVGVLAPNMLRYVERARESKDLANVQAAFSEVKAALTNEDTTVGYGDDNAAIYRGDGLYMAEVKLAQAGDGWSQAVSNLNIGGISYADVHWINEPVRNGVCKVYALDGEFFLDWGGSQVVYNNSNSIAKYVLGEVQKDLSSYIASNSSTYNEIFKKSSDDSLSTTISLPNGKTVNLMIYNRNYDNYQDVTTRLKVANTASLIYNRDTGKMSTIIYYDGQDYTSWSLTDESWVDNSYITKK